MVFDLRDTGGRQMIMNGALVTEQHSDTPYVYQDIHTFGHKARFTKHHIHHLAEAARVLFGKDIKSLCSTGSIEEDISRLLISNSASRHGSVKVELRFDAADNISLRSEEPSIYAGYSLRSIRPTATFVHADISMAQYATSASKAVRTLANAVAQGRGFRTAIITDHNGIIETEPAMPLFMVRGYSIFSPAGYDSVEFSLTEKAIQRAGFKVVRQALTMADIRAADEIFMTDWQGITSILQIDEHPCMDIIANKVAAIMESITTL